MKPNIELLNALEEGKLLYRDEFDDPECREFLFKDIESAKKYPESTSFNYVRKGWGSALGHSEDRIMSILLHPEQWKIHPFDMSEGSKGKPYPWSIRYKE